jgi:hypothetical protein
MPIVFTNRAAFDAAFLTALRENWDTFPDNTVIPNGTTVERDHLSVGNR